MKINELINEAGLIGKLGSAVGKAAQAVGKGAAVAHSMGQSFKQGAEKWKGTGITGGPNKQADQSSGGGQETIPGDVDPNELRDLLTAVLNGQQLNPAQAKTAQKMKNAI